MEKNLTFLRKLFIEILSLVSSKSKTSCMRKMTRISLIASLSLLFLLAIAATFYFKKSYRPIFIGNKSEEMDNPAAAAQYEFDLMKDPATGKIPDGIRAAELAQAARMPLKEGSTFNPS